MEGENHYFALGFGVHLPHSYELPRIRSVGYLEEKRRSRLDASHYLFEMGTDSSGRIWYRQMQVRLIMGKSQILLSIKDHAHHIFT